MKMEPLKRDNDENDHEFDFTKNETNQDSSRVSDMNYSDSISQSESSFGINEENNFDISQPMENSEFWNDIKALETDYNSFDLDENFFDFLLEDDTVGNVDLNVPKSNMKNENENRSSVEKMVKEQEQIEKNTETQESYVKILQRRKELGNDAGVNIDGYKDYYDPWKQDDDQIVDLPEVPFMELLNTPIGVVFPSQEESEKPEKAQEIGSENERDITNKNNVGLRVPSLDSDFYYEDSSEDDEPIPPPTKETRARRKRDIIILRKENKRLLKEQSLFYRDILALEEQIEQRIRGNDPSVISENFYLLNEIENHRIFLRDFASLTNFRADRKEARKRVLNQGIDTAKSYILGLIADSTNWTAAVKPAEVDIPLPDLQFRYHFSRDCFGITDNSSNFSSSNKRRLNLRVDARVPTMQAEYVSEIFWRSLCNTDEHQRLYGTRMTEVEPVDTPSDSLPDPNTKIVRFKKRFSNSRKEQETFFIAHKEITTLPKSTLAFKKRIPLMSSISHSNTKSQGTSKRGRKPKVVNQKLSDEDDLEDFSVASKYGSVPVHMVSMSTTTLLPSLESVTHLLSDEEDYSSSSTQNKNQKAKGIEGMVIKGAITREDENGYDSHFTVVYSVPEDYKIMDSVGFDSIIDKKNMMTTLFADILRNVAREFKVMISESIMQGSLQSPSSSSSSVISNSSMAQLSASSSWSSLMQNQNIPECFKSGNISASQLTTPSSIFVPVDTINAYDQMQKTYDSESIQGKNMKRKRQPDFIGNSKKCLLSSSSSSSSSPPTSTSTSTSTSNHVESE